MTREAISEEPSKNGASGKTDERVKVPSWLMEMERPSFFRREEHEVMAAIETAQKNVRKNLSID